MKFIDIIRSANGNLWRAKLRTFLTISAIFVGAFTLTLTTALGAGAQQYLDRQLGNVTAPGVMYVSQKQESNPFAGTNEIKEYDPEKPQGTIDPRQSSLTQADVDKLRSLENIEYAKPYYSINADYITRSDNAKKYVPNTVTQYNALSLDLAAGRLLTNRDTESLILPEVYLGPLGFANAEEAIDKQITLAYRNNKQQLIELKLTVVGVMKKSFVTQGEMYVDEASAATIAKAQGQSDHFLAVIAKFSDTQTDEAILKKRITDAGNYSAISLKEQISTITTIVSAITTALGVVGVIALFAASFGIINTLLMSVYERTQEVGLMKALGMHRREVFALFAFEAVLVGFWGSLLASVVGWLIAQGISQWASESFLKDFEGFTLLMVTPWNAFFVVALIMLIAFLAGTLPAIKASRLNPIDALRSE
jgi:putative ABC transport system permease protein